MRELLDVLTYVSLSSDSEHDHAPHALSFQANASAEDTKNENKASHDSTNNHPNYTEVFINSRSLEPKRDTENGGATSEGQSGAPGVCLGRQKPWQWTKRKRQLD